MSEIILDRKTFGALAEETRVKILKSLRERPKMQSELAKEQKLAVSTIAEHLEKLEAANLVRAKRGGHKWVYFSLTQKGERVVSPERHTGIFVFALSVSLFMVVGGLFALYSHTPQTNAGVADIITDDKQAMSTGGKSTEPIIVGPSTSESVQLIESLPEDAVYLAILCTGAILLVATAALWIRLRQLQQ